MKPKKAFNKPIAIMVAALLIFASGLQVATAAKNAPVRMIPENFSVLAKDVSPAVVHIRVEKTVQGGAAGRHHFGNQPFQGDDRFKDFFDEFFGGRNPREFHQRNPHDFKQKGLGTGFIIDQDGYIVTNNHVVKDADQITVVFNDEREFDAEIVGRDPHTDLALIKIDANKDLPTVRLGSSDKLQVGEWVAAIGSPFGLEQTVTAGIVSAKGRVIGSGPYDDFIQTDASINPGNSGGPLINMNGEVVGINTAIIAGGQGIGFAIPIDLATGVIKQLKADGEVTRGWLGITIQDLKGDLAEYYGVKDKTGVLVASVIPGDPADEAGIKAHDIILEVNGEKVKTSRNLTAKSAKLAVGDKASVTVLRDGKEKTLSVKVGKRSLTLAATDAPQHKKETEYGFQVADLTPEMARRFNMEENKGVVVVGVNANSKADKAGIQKGDLILEVNRQDVESVSEFKKLIQDDEGANGIDLLIKRIQAGYVVIHLV
ncbi:MAG: DegQ family serine endoprotease [Desulfobacterales bacterium]|jgi:serine protease Do|nr:DegQ family serine endoprotease [Deltaproteobacteria bacterium]